MSALSTDSNSNVSIYQQAIALGTQFNATENWHFLVGGCYSKVKYDRWMINNKTQCQTYQSLYHGALTDNWQVRLGYTYTKSVFMEDEGSNFRIDASIRNTIYQIILARPGPITTTANRRNIVFSLNWQF